MSYFACPVCMEDYVSIRQPNEPVVWSRTCGHVVHKSCLSRWLNTCRAKSLPTTCPKCSRPIDWNVDIQQLFDGVRPYLKRSHTPPTSDISMENVADDAEVEMDLTDVPRLEGEKKSKQFPQPEQ